MSLSKVLGLILVGLVVLGSFGLIGSSVVVSCFGYVGSWLDWMVLLDDVSVVCIYMLLCCGVIALFFNGHYFGGDKEGYVLRVLIVWFLGVMGILIFSSSFIFTLVCWEYLGLVSFFLILFYSNGVSLRAAVITLVASRFGDVALFLVVAWFIGFYEVHYIGLVVVTLVVLTKSACFPFISWLLEAMRAPTPVSSLVHSSTLVAAGVWFLLRYDYIFSGEFFGVLLFLSLLTIIVTGVCAIYFEDLKKIVALSTCNNVSWCILFFICGDYSLCLLQLVTHGVCKCFLFMSVGDLMLGSGGSQSSVGGYLPRYSGGLNVVLQTVLISALCGLPFIGVFFTKHVFLSGVVYVVGAGFVVCLFLALFLSYAYSFRFMMMLLRGFGGLGFGYCSSFVLIGWLSLLGSLLNYYGGGILDESVQLSFLGGGAVIGAQVVGFLVGWQVYLGGWAGGIWSSVLWGSDCLVENCYLQFQRISGLYLLGVYRWEVYILRMMGSFASSSGFNISIFSLNFTACAIGISIMICFLLV